MKKKLNKFFRELRKAGYFAKQNFLCCSSCGWADIPEEQKKKAVFYHAQDVPSIKNGFVYLSWAGDGTEICNIGNSCGFVTGWNGTENERIRLIDLEAIKEASE